MATISTFIDEGYLRQFSQIELNIDSSTIIPSIIHAERLHLEQTLGTCLFRELQTAIANDTLSGDSLSLVVEHIKPASCFWTVYELLPYLHMQLRNKGVQKASSENSVPVELNELKFLSDRARNNGEFYTQRLIDYLTANDELFPSYRDCTGTDKLKPSSTKYFSGIFIPGMNSYNCDGGVE